LGLKPYAKDTHYSQFFNWPAGYAAEQFRATKKSGQKAYRTIVVPQWSLKDFGSKLRGHLRDNGVEWAEGLFFMHTIRGIKLGTQHTKTRDAAELALMEMIEEAHLDEEAMGSGSWWIDVGLEFSSKKDECLQWMTASHRNVVREALGIDDSNAIRITTLGSSKYSRDLASHLPGVSGCRIEPGVRAQGCYEAAYLQIYTTDKSVTYLPEGHQKAKRISMEEAMKGGQGFVEGLFTTYWQASLENSSNTRVEVRVPFQFATTALVNVDPSTFHGSMLSFSKRDWW
jgi:hypothetical protein